MKPCKNTGTREWSDVSHNIGIGCSHGCLYCYAAAYAIERGIVSDRDDWLNERITPRNIPKKDGVIMFPTAHDITPYNLEASQKAIDQMMLAGRNVLIVTKAHLECVKAICEKFKSDNVRIVLRVTIGSMDEQECKFWEPGAPTPSERLSALKYAHSLGYTTSVSMEPILIGVADAIKTFDEVEPFVTEKVWIGKMNYPDTRVDTSVVENRKKVASVKVYQSDEEIIKLYGLLKAKEKVEWKDSIARIVGRQTS